MQPDRQKRTLQLRALASQGCPQPQGDGNQHQARCLVPDGRRGASAHCSVPSPGLRQPPAPSCCPGTVPPVDRVPQAAATACSARSPDGGRPGLLRPLSWACRQLSSPCDLTRSSLCASASQPPLIRTSVMLGQGHPGDPVQTPSLCGVTSGVLGVGTLARESWGHNSACDRCQVTPPALPGLDRPPPRQAGAPVQCLEFSALPSRISHRKHPSGAGLDAFGRKHGPRCRPHGQGGQRAQPPGVLVPAFSFLVKTLSLTPACLSF